MRVAFFASEKEREQSLAEAFAQGCAAHGDKCSILDPSLAPAWGCDVAVMVGVKSLACWQINRASGLQTIMIDKGYVRHRVRRSRTWEYWRVAVNAHQPTGYLMEQKCPPERWNGLGIALQQWRAAGRHILFAGSSAKYHAFHGLPHPTEYARRIVNELRRVTRREIVYRPKPSWRDAEPIPGTRFSDGDATISGDLAEAFALVTHGSNSCFEAIVAGVPCLILGNAVARPISATEVSQIENPVRCAEKTRLRWASALAYQQWTMEEFASGDAWDHLRKALD